MIIGIDGNEANTEVRVGVNEYCYEVIRAIAKLEDEWKGKHIICVYLKDKPKDFLPKATKFFKYKIVPGGGAWILTKLVPDIFFSKDKPDVFFSPHHYAPPISPVPVVCTIHDLGYLKFSGQFKKYDFWQLKLWSAWSIYISKHIISVSNSTKEDIVRHYPFASGKISTVLHGYDSSRFNRTINDHDVRRVKQKYAIVNDYVLYLGTLKPSKNIEGLLAAWKDVLDDFPNYSLVIAGKKGWLYESIFEKVKELGLAEHIIFTDYISEGDKVGLIGGAKVFVLPSFWEGFGLDILNAMASGVPVVLSNVGSLPEVAGGVGVLVDPNETKSISSGIKKVLSMSKKQYNMLVAEGLERVKSFSWEKTARETLRVIENTKTG